MDMESSNGNLEVFTKETMKKIKRVGMVKCTGMMEILTKDSGKTVSVTEKEQKLKETKKNKSSTDSIKKSPKQFKIEKIRNF